MKKVTIELSYEAIDEIVIQHLKESYEDVSNTIRTLSDMDEDELKSFQKEDLKDFRKIRKSLKRVLRYYMVHEDFVSFMEEME